MRGTNARVRETLKQHKMYQWQLADLMGISEPSFTRLMRHELSEEKQKEMISLIETEAK